MQGRGGKGVSPSDGGHCCHKAERAAVGGSHGLRSHRLIPNPPASGEGPSSRCRTGDPTLARPQQDEAGPREYEGHTTSWHEASQPGTGVALAPPSLTLCPMTPRHFVTAAGGAAAGGGMGEQLGTPPARVVAGERKFKQGRAEGTAPLEACALHVTKGGSEVPGLGTRDWREGRKEEEVEGWSLDHHSWAFTASSRQRSREEREKTHVILVGCSHTHTDCPPEAD